MKLVLILSIILNILFLIIIFFKSALNEILSDLYKRHRQKQENIIANLINLRILMFEYSSLLGDILFQIIFARFKNVDIKNKIVEQTEEIDKLNKKWISFSLPGVVDSRMLNDFKNSLISFRDLISEASKGQLLSIEVASKKKEEIQDNIYEIMGYIEEKIKKLNKKII